MVKLDQPVPIVVASVTVKMVLMVGGRQINSVVNNVLYLPELQYNLFSIQRVGKLEMRVTFGNDAVEIKRGPVDDALVTLSVKEYEL